MNRTLHAFLGAAVAGLWLWVAVPASAGDWGPDGWRPRCQYCNQPVSLLFRHRCAEPVVLTTATEQLAPPGKSAFVSAGSAPAPVGKSNVGTPLPEPSEMEPWVHGAPQGGMAPGAPGAPSAPVTPEAAAPPSAAAPFEMPTAAAPAAGLGGGLGRASGALVMIGDEGPIFTRGTPLPTPQPPSQPQPPSPPQPPQPPRPRPFIGQAAAKGEDMLPWVRGFKIADNMSPRPQDRVFFSFNYFNQLNYAVNERIGAPVSNLQVYRYQFGIEKTFLDGNASIGVRDGLNTLSANSPIPGIGGTSTAMGDLTIFTKFVLWQMWDDPSQMASAGYPFPTALVNGGLISAGLAVTTPTGPGGFAGAPFSKSFRSTQLQPFVGYFWSRGNFYFQGFEAINVPTESRDVTILYTDVGVGYFYYRSPDPDSWLTAAAATFEVHVNDPMNHRHPFDIADPIGIPDVVDLTYGTNFFLSQHALLSLAVVTPVSGPRPFDFEAVALLNIYFGGSRGARRLAGPPVMGY